MSRPALRQFGLGNMLLKSPDLVAERSAFGEAVLYRRNRRNPNLPRFVTVSSPPERWPSSPAPSSAGSSPTALVTWSICSRKTPRPHRPVVVPALRFGHR